MSLPFFLPILIQRCHLYKADGNLKNDQKKSDRRMDHVYSIWNSKP